MIAGLFFVLIFSITSVLYSWNQNLNFLNQTLTLQKEQLRFNINHRFS